jgi:hypothetical protein
MFDEYIQRYMERAIAIGDNKWFQQKGELDEIEDFIRGGVGCGFDCLFWPSISSGDRSLCRGQRQPEYICHCHVRDSIGRRSKASNVGHPDRFAGVGDPIGTGLVASLARPGGNVTGLSIQATDLAGKRLELLREIVPDLHRLATIANADVSPAMLEMPRFRQRLARLGSR